MIEAPFPNNIYLNLVFEDIRGEIRDEQIQIQSEKVNDYLILAALYKHTTRISEFEGLESPLLKTTPKDRFFDQWVSNVSLGKSGYKYLIEEIYNITGISEANNVQSQSSDVNNNLAVWRDGRKSLKSYMDSFKEGVTMTDEHRKFAQKSLPPFLSAVKEQIERFL